MDTQLKYKRNKHTWKVDEESYLGFLNINYFKSKTSGIDLEEILHNKLLSNKYDKPINEVENSPLKYEGYKQFGPIYIDKLIPEDFKKMNFFELNYLVDKFWENYKNGDDWPVFKSHWEYIIHELNGYKIQERDFYYINIESVRQELLPSEHFFNYFIGVVSIEKKSKDIITFYLGAD